MVRIIRGCAEYRFWCGEANISENGRIHYASVSLNYKVGLYIIGDRLTIYDIRYDGKPVSWGYSAENGEIKDIWPHKFQLEDERIDAMLREKNISCPVWPRICRRAKEIWLEEISNRPKLKQYTPEYND